MGGPSPKGLVEPCSYWPPLLSGDYVSCQLDEPVPDKVRKGCPHASVEPARRKKGGKGVGESRQTPTLQNLGRWYLTVLPTMLWLAVERASFGPVWHWRASTSNDSCPVFPKEKRKKNTGLCVTPPPPPMMTTMTTTTVVPQLQGCGLEDN